MQRNVPDSKILADVKLKRRKCAHIIKKVLSKVETEKPIEVIKTVSSFLDYVFYLFLKLFFYF